MRIRIPNTTPGNTNKQDILCPLQYLWCRAWYFPGRRGGYLAAGGEHAAHSLQTDADPYPVTGYGSCLSLWCGFRLPKWGGCGFGSTTLLLGTQQTKYLVSPTVPLVPSLILSRHERRVFGSRWRTRSTLSGSAFKRLLTPQTLHKTKIVEDLTTSRRILENKLSIRKARKYSRVTAQFIIYTITFIRTFYLQKNCVLDLDWVSRSRKAKIQ